jgi:ketosteroid isomerase-like protein
MSRENVGKVAAAFAAFNRGDVDRTLEHVAPDAEWHPAVLPFLGVDALRGRDAIREFFTSEIVPGIEGFQATPLEIDDLGDHVLVKTAYRGRMAGTDDEVEQVMYSLFTFRAGKVVRQCDYRERTEAIEAAGVTA